MPHSHPSFLIKNRYMPESPKKYIGYFYGLDDCDHRYYVELNPHPDNPNVGVREITLAANPCTVTYDNQQSPFEPVMKSHMAINVISGNWLFDLYSQDAHSTHAKLWKENGEQAHPSLIWAGFVTNNLLNMPQDGCVNTFTINCDDCLATLEDYDYRVLSLLDTAQEAKPLEYKQVITFADLLRNIADKCVHIRQIVVDASLIGESNTRVQPSDLKISEKNFFSSDIDEEPWKFSEVLEEMCRWLGMTAIQVGSTLYIFDRQAHTTVQPVTDANVTSYYYAYSSSNPFTTWTYGTYTVQNIGYREDNVGGSGSDISMDTIYNTVTVKDSFYEIEEFVPDLFNDDYLTNYDGDEWAAVNVPCGQPVKPKYINKKRHQKEDADDSVNDYYLKQWIHKWYTPHRYNEWLEPALYADLIVRMTGTSHEGSYGAYTSFTTHYTVKNRSNKRVTHTCSQVEHYGYTGTGTYFYDNVVSVNLTLQPFEETSFDLTFTTFHQSTTDFSPQFKVDNGVYTSLAGEGAVYGRPTRSMVTADISDLAVVAKAKDASFYDRQIQDTIKWDRWLMISQFDRPSDLLNPRLLTQQQARLLYPSLMSLNSGYRNPMILDENAFLAINGTAKIERYKREYINENWTGDSTGIGGDYNCTYWGIITGTSEIYTFPLALWFRLKVGDYFWDGTQWTTTDSMFYVDVSTNVDEDGYIDFSQLWNTNFQIINNISYTTYSGASGYKIPLTGVQFDFSKPIQFSIHLPSRVQQYSGSPTANDGMNSYVYIQDLSVELFTKGSEKKDLSDVAYENVIDEGSNNELSEITCRFTTYPNEGQHSYSSVGYLDGLADEFARDGLGNSEQKEEEALVKMYTNQYSTPTIMETVVMDMSPSILSRIKDTDMDKFFHITGMEINYADGVKTLSLVESKEYNEQ